jgi:CheY-like chemotaxis protein
MKIMIVDDDPATLMVVGTILQRQGYEVIERDTAIGTTLAILREKPDVVVLDVRMPGLTGDKLAALISQQTTPRPVVVLHSSLPESELQELVQSSGAAGFVPKGVSPRAFIGKLEQVVAGARRLVAKKLA